MAFGSRFEKEYPRLESCPLLGVTTPLFLVFCVLAACLNLALSWMVIPTGYQVWMGWVSEADRVMVHQLPRFTCILMTHLRTAPCFWNETH